MTDSQQWVRDGGLPVSDVIEKAVIRVIEAMRQNLGEPLTIDDLASAAMFSKFHFNRIFQRVTGVSPGRFLSALRMQEAKRLLLSTSLSITDITHVVGYSSVGTFSSRFKKSVGLTPSEFRRLGGFTPVIHSDNRPRFTRPSCTKTLLGQVLAPAVTSPLGMVFVGLFRDWIPQGMPVEWTVLRGPGPYRLENIPPGTWHLLAYAMAPRHEQAGGVGAQEHSLLLGTHGPIPIHPETGVTRADLQLRRMRMIDPPILLALLDVGNETLRQGFE